MNNCLVISELSYFQEVSGINVIGGGSVAATTGTTATAKPGSASAGEFASAQGQYVGIQTQTKAEKGQNFSIAQALAEAYGKTGNNTAQSLSSSDAVSITGGHSTTGIGISISFNSVT